MDTAGIVTIITVLGGQLAILIPMWRRQAATKTAVEATQSDVADVKDLVNGGHAVLVARVDQLQTTIGDLGGTVPATPPAATPDGGT